MKSLALLLVLSSAAFADTVPPIDAFSMTGIQSQIYSQTLDSALWGPQTFTSSIYIGPGNPFGTICTAIATGSLSATLLTGTFDPKTDTVTGTFQGFENVWKLPRKNFSRWEYAVLGTFTEQVNFNGKGAVNIDITSATFIGMSSIPEPSTIVLLGTGLLGLCLRSRSFLTARVQGYSSNSA